MKVLVLVVLFVASATSKNLYAKESSIFFPDPAKEGGLILANLEPSPDFKLANPEDVHFYLYTKENPDQLVELFPGDLDSIDGSTFDPEGSVKLLIHGFGGGYDHSFPWTLRGEYVKQAMTEKMNVILMDWETLSASPDYFGAVQNAQIASSTAAEFLNFLVTEGKTTWAKVHLIGYSLGGQVVGQIGHKIQQLAGGAKASRITALDPALPLFDVAHPDNRTSPDDASFVDVIHTAANGFLGMFEASGHVDSYPNGGRYQPGCGIDLTGSCAHGRAPAIFTESVFATDEGDSTKFYGLKCESFENFEIGACAGNDEVEVGHFTPSDATGTYFFHTKAQSPFAKPLP